MCNAHGFFLVVILIGSERIFFEFLQSFFLKKIYFVVKNLIYLIENFLYIKSANAFIANGEILLFLHTNLFQSAN